MPNPLRKQFFENRSIFVAPQDPDFSGVTKCLALQAEAGEMGAGKGPQSGPIDLVMIGFAGWSLMNHGRLPKMAQKNP